MYEYKKDWARPETLLFSFFFFTLPHLCVSLLDPCFLFFFSFSIDFYFLIASIFFFLLEALPSSLLFFVSSFFGMEFLEFWMAWPSGKVT